jgi:hypothetical protein
MATNQTSVPASAGLGFDRIWNEWAYTAFLVLVRRKHHSIAPPTIDPKDLSDEELINRIDLLRELAHLPPG